MKRGIACAAALCCMALLPACTAKSSHSNTLTGSPSASGSSDAKSDAAVRLLWAEFFSATTSPDKRQALLQNGSSFKDVLAAQSSQGPISATVTSVRFPDASHASVSFSLRVGSATHLPSVAGAAVLQGGRWLVSKSTM